MKLFLNSLFFGSEKIYQLALLRFALVAYLVFELPGHFFNLHGALSMPAEFMNPGIFLRYSPLPFPIPELEIDTYHTIMIELGALAALGFLTRISLFLFTLGYAHLLAIESAWGWHDHGPSLVAQVLLLLCFAPGTTSYSIDSLWRAVKKRREGDFWKHFSGAEVKRWGFVTLLLLVSTFYFTSGLSKLRYGGTYWPNGKTLSFYLSGMSRSNHLQQYGSALNVPAALKWKDGYGLQFYIYGANPSPVAKQLAQEPGVAAFGAMGAVLLELLFPLIFLGRRIRSLILLASGIFHFCIYQFMGIAFFTWCIIDFSLIDWRALFRRTRNIRNS